MPDSTHIRFFDQISELNYWDLKDSIKDDLHLIHLGIALIENTVLQEELIKSLPPNKIKFLLKALGISLYFFEVRFPETPNLVDIKIKLINLMEASIPLIIEEKSLRHTYSHIYDLSLAVVLYYFNHNMPDEAIAWVVRGRQHIKSAIDMANNKIKPTAEEQRDKYDYLLSRALSNFKIYQILEEKYKDESNTGYLTIISYDILEAYKILIADESVFEYELPIGKKTSEYAKEFLWVDTINTISYRFSVELEDALRALEVSNTNWGKNIDGLNVKLEHFLRVLIPFIRILFVLETGLWHPEYSKYRDSFEGTFRKLLERIEHILLTLFKRNYSLMNVYSSERIAQHITRLKRSKEDFINVYKNSDAYTDSGFLFDEFISKVLSITNLQASLRKDIREEI